MRGTGGICRLLSQAQPLMPALSPCSHMGLHSLACSRRLVEIFMSS
ncbi:MAG TPA: hypothetical protein VGC91_15775 [Pyrinomonadaceae bacterium]